MSHVNTINTFGRASSAATMAEMPADKATERVCAAGGDCYMPPAGAPPITQGDATKEAIIVLGRLLEGNQTSILAALTRLEQNATKLPLEKVSPFEMVVLILIEILRTEPQLADKVKGIIIQIVVDGPYPFGEKASIMTKLARIYNQDDTTDIQKDAVISVFDAAMESAKRDVFLAGLMTVRQLNDPDKAETADYLSKFAYHAHDETEIGSDIITQIEYINALKDYSNVQAKNMLPLMDEITSLWFDNPNARILWNAMMFLSGLELNCEIPSNDGGAPFVVPFKTVIATLFEKYFYDEENFSDQARIAISEKIIEYLDYNAPYFPQGQFVPALHVAIIENIIEKGETETRKAILKAVSTQQQIVRSLENTDKERAIATTYFRLMLKSDVRKETLAIALGIDDLSHRMLKFMIDDERKWDKTGRFLRDATHTLITDGSPYYKSSIIVTYGVPLLEEGAVEAVTDKAPAGEIGNQCEATLKKLYEARYIINPLADISISAAVQPANSFAGPTTIERDPGMFAARFDWMGPEWNMFRWRTLFGAEYARGTSAQSASVMLGTGRKFQDVSDALFVKSFLFAGWLNMFGKDDDSGKIPLKINSSDAPPYNAKVVAPEIDIHAFQIGAGLQLGMEAFRVRLGRGRQFSLRPYVETRAGLWAGMIKDDGCRRALEPKSFSGNEGDLSTGANFTLRCLDNEAIAGYNLTATAGITGEF